MDNQNNDLRQHIEAIESCRANGDDMSVEFPETMNELASNDQLREFSSYVSETDRKIRDAIGSVSIPDGLADRLLASVAVETAGAHKAVRPTANQFLKRRWATIAACLTITAACLITAAMLAFPQNTASKELDETFALLQSIPAGKWESPPIALPADITAPAFRFREVKTKRGTVKLVSLTASGNAVLMILPSSGSALPPNPQDVVGGTTGRYQYTAWAVGNQVFLLSVKDGNLGDFLRRPNSIAVLALQSANELLSAIDMIVTGNPSLNWV